VRFTLLISVGLLLAAGCGPGGDFPVAPTSGRVVCEGQPVPHVMVFFEPLQEGKSALVGKQGFAFADEQGNFAISTYGSSDGAVVGKHRVRVGPPDREEHPGFRCPCVLNSEIDVAQVEVKAGEDNEFELVLKKRTRTDPLPLDR
jgi:hypothetical protein